MKKIADIESKEHCCGFLANIDAKNDIGDKVKQLATAILLRIGPLTLEPDRIALVN